jgi:non-ribosomal peptide synthetase component E (peptide arylation enzyme)
MTPIGALHGRASKHPDSVAFVAGDDAWSYRHLATKAEQLAFKEWLLSEADLDR